MTFFLGGGGKGLIGFIYPVNAHIHSFLAASDHIKELFNINSQTVFALIIV